MFKLAVIGDPIAHSLSPAIHGAVLELLGINYEYEKAKITTDSLQAWVGRVKIENINGFNVTMPHKINIISFLDKLDPMIERFKAVNTVKNDNGILTGFNTDAGGFSLTLKERDFSFKNKKALIAGSGGASSVIKLALEDGGADVKVLKRTELSHIINYAPDTSIFINATPLGMHGTTDDWESLEFVKYFPKNCLVYDLLYNPPRTELIKAAENRGLLCINGLDMLIYQAILADEIYLQRKLDVLDIKKKIETVIKNQSLIF